MASTSSWAFEDIVNRSLLCSVALFVLILLWCIYKLWLTPIPGATLPVGSAMAPQLVKVHPEIESIQDITERPLFWKSRRPLLEVEPEEPQENDSTGDLDKIKVLGVYANGAMVAGVKDKGRIAVGEEVFGWTLESIKGNSLEFSKAGRKKQLLLELSTPVAASRGSNRARSGAQNLVPKAQSPKKGVKVK